MLSPLCLLNERTNNQWCIQSTALCTFAMKRLMQDNTLIAHISTGLWGKGSGGDGSHWPSKADSQKNQYVLTITDLYTKWVVAEALQTKSANEVSAALVSKMYSFGSRHKPCSTISGFSWSHVSTGVVIYHLQHKCKQCVLCFSDYSWSPDREVTFWILYLHMHFNAQPHRCIYHHIVLGVTFSCHHHIWITVTFSPVLNRPLMAIAAGSSCLWYAIYILCSSVSLCFCLCKATIIITFTYYLFHSMPSASALAQYLTSWK